MADARKFEGSGISRREFVKTVGTVAAAATSGLILPSSLRADDKLAVGPSPKAPAETAVSRFYASLKEDQRKLLCFPFDDPKRSQVQNNWHIVKTTIGELTKEQQALCDEILKALCSEDGYDRFKKQMEHDSGGLESYSVAVFGEPGTDKPFEWILTGRHDTLRADGNSVEGAAFGGPIFYGHDATGSGNDDAQHSGNVWWFQGAQANAIFKTLDDKQQARALLAKGDPDAPRSIKLKGDGQEIPGLAVAELDGQQKQMVQKLLKDLTSPFRAFDVEEIHECLKDAGGVDKLRLTYYKDGDIGNDKVWDIWKLEGPAFAWYFHGSPHVHTWVNIARKAPKA